MIHIRSGVHTFCGKSLDDLAKSDPMDAIVALMFAVSGNEDALTLRRRIDAIADQATCPACRMTYADSIRQSPSFGAMNPDDLP